MKTRLLMTVALTGSIAWPMTAEAADSAEMLDAPEAWQTEVPSDDYVSSFQWDNRPAVVCDGEWLAASCVTRRTSADGAISLRRDVVIYRLVDGNWMLFEVIGDPRPFVGNECALTGLTPDRDQKVPASAALALHGDTLIIGASEKDACPVRTYRFRDGAWTLESVLETGHRPDSSAMGLTLCFDGTTLCVGTYQYDADVNQPRDLVQLFRRNHDHHWVKFQTIGSPQYPMSAHFGMSMGLANGSLVIGSSGMLNNRLLGGISMFEDRGDRYSSSMRLTADGPESMFLGNRAMALAGTNLFAVTPERHRTGFPATVHLYQKDKNRIWHVGGSVCIEDLLKELDPDSSAPKVFHLTASGDSAILAVGREDRAGPWMLVFLECEGKTLRVTGTTTFEKWNVVPEHADVRLHRAMARHGDSIIAFVLERDQTFGDLQPRPRLIVLTPE